MELFSSLSIKNQNILSIFDEIAKEVFDSKIAEKKENSIDSSSKINELKSREKQIISQLDKVLDFPNLLEIKNEQLNQIKAEIVQHKAKNTTSKSKVKLEEFQSCLRYLTTHPEVLASQWDNQKILSLLFMLVYGGKIKYEDLEFHTPIFFKKSLRKNKNKNPQNEGLSENSFWQSAENLDHKAVFTFLEGFLNSMIKWDIRLEHLLHTTQIGGFLFTKIILFIKLFS